MDGVARARVDAGHGAARGRRCDGVGLYRNHVFRGCPAVSRVTRGGSGCGIETLRARRLLSFLLTPECGLGPHKFAGCKLGWTVSGDDGTRQYGLFAELPL